jgi:hypothetical protein
MQKKHDPPKTPPKPADVFQPLPVAPPVVVPPVVPPVVPAVPAAGRGTVVFNEAHNTTHRYSYAPAPKAMHYTPLPSTTTHVDMDFVHHMEQFSAAGAVKTI